MSVRPLDAATAPLTGTQAIEASAGTGKTWSIAALYLRLVVEQGLPVERILVVTYTTSATAELRERIRARLTAALAAFASEGDDRDGGHGGDHGQDDPVLAALRARIDPRRAQALLTLALESFDLAAIHTIHGFCQRALEERAFESGEEPDTVLLSDEGALLRAVAQDFWRRELADATPAWGRWLASRLAGPDGLVATLRGHFGKPYLQTVLPPPDDETAGSRFAAACDVARALWQAEGTAWCDRLCDWPGLSAVSHKPEQIRRAAETIDAWWRAGAPADAAPRDALRKFSRDALVKATTKAAIKAGAGTPGHPLFDAMQALVDACEAREAAFERRFGHFLARARHEGEAALAERKAQAGRLGFDDLLTRLAAALSGPGGPRLAERLCVRYGAALIDEFQDTDPVQYAIFEQVFHRGGLPLFFVGDPKQAIYSFRGADLPVYLAARQQARERWALTVNRRSVPDLVAAVNAVFSRRADAFRCEGLAFDPVAATPHPPPALIVGDASPAPFTLWFMPRDGGVSDGAGGEQASGKGSDKATEKTTEKNIDKTAAHRHIAQAVAADIARLLAPGRARIGDRLLNGGDVAVLVKSHRQGQRMQAALADLGVPCVRYGQDNVFDTREALEIERLLLAVAEPARGGLVKAALATDLLGRRGDDLAALDADASAWEVVVSRFIAWQQRCRERGFAAFWHDALMEEGVAERLLTLPDGERRMTNLQHLADLLQQRSHDEGWGPEGLAKWLADQRRGEVQAENAPVEGEARLLRLENDEALVKIVTIHGSKGLEYPVVYCPWLWDGPMATRRNGPLAFHDRDAGGASALDFGSDDYERHRLWAEEEQAQEQLRLAYVALTRAKHRCVVVWGGIRGAERSPLGWLLHGDLDLKASNDGALRADLAELRAACPVIEVADLPLPDREVLDDRTPGDRAMAERFVSPGSSMSLTARPFRGTVPPAWRTHSFTAWHATEAEADLPDHDVWIAGALADPALQPREAADGPVEVSDFPRGAEAGVCLHGLMDRLPFADLVEPEGRGGPGVTAAVDAVVDAALAESAIASTWAPVARHLLAAVVATPLDGSGGCSGGKAGVRLRDVPPAAQMREMEFLMPVGVPDRDALAAAIGPGAGADGHLAERVARLSPPRVAGFLKGFVDLVFEHEGQWQVVDYKSNWLGPRWADYGPEALARAMAEENYDLQALIYAVAVARLLRWRQGHAASAPLTVSYLFLRGMQPGVPGSGVFRWQPDPGLIARVDAVLNRETVR